MTDNTIKKDTKAEDGQIIERAQKRLKNARLKNLRKGLKGGWRRIALGFGVNVRYVFDLAVHGVVPPNPDTRRKLGLPRVMPSEPIEKIRLYLSTSGYCIREEKEDEKALIPRKKG